MLDNKGVEVINASKIWWRRPVLWIVAWGVYSLLALAYVGYQSAWLSTLCLTPP